MEHHTGSEVTTNGEGSGGDAAAAGPQFPLRVIALVEGHGENVAGTPSGPFGYVTMIERGEDPNKGLQTLPMMRNSSIAYEVAGESLRRYRASASAAIVTETHRLVVPFQVIKENGHTVSTVLHSEDDKVALKLHSGASAEGCGDPAIAPWENGRMLMITPCDVGHRRVYEFAEDGGTWTEALGTLSRVWGNSWKRTGPGVRGDVITLTIGEKKVMLFAHPLQLGAGTNDVTGSLHLWLTDAKKHIFDVGPISEVGEGVGATSLLYKSEQLSLLYESGENTSRSLVFTSLSAQLARIKEVVKTWEEVDQRVGKLCPSPSGEKAAAPTRSCDAAVLTEGLVGYWSGNVSGSQWQDEYLCVNAAVKDGAKTNDNGVAFRGRGAGAQWPVGKQGPNQLYHFANYNFTLLAVVTIHKVPKGGSGIPLMGVKLNGPASASLVELLYDESQRWKVVYKNEAKQTQEKSWEPNTHQYQVALTLQNGRPPCTLTGSLWLLKVMRFKGTQRRKFHISTLGVWEATQKLRKAPRREMSRCATFFCTTVH
ncbi:trans-sialidase [Trypanosoma conorhini]|uniref:Trans-sialidase n=1 Tax=Trypanosoma conorhini TaxID=83891 RepID=A0A3R7R5C5_9TRYP|nr:trans-sialidase [Trypanosoma conorhini]RNE96264.1 trans-sialidase [Trypanosoma conorhini]